MAKLKLTVMSAAGRLLLPWFVLRPFDVMVLAYVVSLEIKNESDASTVATKLVEFAEQYKKDKGTLAWFVMQDPKDARKFAIYERYEDKGANPTFKEFGAFFKPLLASAPKLTLYEELPRGGSKL
ncbi:hypothetical protein OIO90_006238 [Microbotryomycetes sp. JL221]|nr:hypothetical protein OIO90_006238 [Microbotryomycetes sp. JL221]